jgi:Domain of unknown function (DUF1707)
MTYQYFWDRVAGRDPDLRAADADRERVAELLRTSHTEGRLDMAEFQERLERCYKAKTLGELDELVRDLPRQDEQEERLSIGWFRPLRWHVPQLARLAPLLIVLVVVSAAAGHHVFWLWVPLVFLLWRMSWSRRRRSWAGTRRGWEA